MSNKSDGAYRIVNKFVDTKKSGTLGGNIHLFPGTLEEATMSRGGNIVEVGPPGPYGPDEEQSQRFTFNASKNGAKTPGQSATYLPPVPKKGFCHHPVPRDNWTLNYKINAPGNLNSAAEGSFQIDPHKFIEVIFLYYINQINGTGWYAYQINEYSNSSFSGKPTNKPNFNSIGNNPAARFSNS